MKKTTRSPGVKKGILQALGQTPLHIWCLADIRAYFQDHSWSGASQIGKRLPEMHADGEILRVSHPSGQWAYAALACEIPLEFPLAPPGEPHANEKPQKGLFHS